MPYRLEIAGAPPPVDLPSWQDPKFVSEPVGMTPEAIWNQALSEYEARLKKPRTDVWGNTLAEDRPESLDRTIMAPLRAQFGIPEPKSPWSGPIELPGGRVVQVNTVTGDPRVIVAGGNQMPSGTPVGKAYRDLEELQKRFNSARTDQEAQQIWQEINSLQSWIKKEVQGLPKPPPTERTTMRIDPTTGQRSISVSGVQPAGTYAKQLADEESKKKQDEKAAWEVTHPIPTYGMSFDRPAMPGMAALSGRAPTMPTPAGVAPPPVVPAAAAARSPVLDTSVPTYGSENEARAAGLKAGAVVYLLGVGKVRLE